MFWTLNGLTSSQFNLSPYAAVVSFWIRVADITIVFIIINIIITIIVITIFIFIVFIIIIVIVVIIIIIFIVVLIIIIIITTFSPTILLLIFTDEEGVKEGEEGVRRRGKMARTSRLVISRRTYKLP